MSNKTGVPWLARMPPPPPPPPIQFIPYDVPIRPGVRARLVLPMDLSEAEAEKLCGFLIAVAFTDADLAAAKDGAPAQGVR